MLDQIREIGKSVIGQIDQKRQQSEREKLIRKKVKVLDGNNQNTSLYIHRQPSVRVIVSGSSGLMPDLDSADLFVVSPHATMEQLYFSLGLNSDPSSVSITNYAETPLRITPIDLQAPESNLPTARLDGFVLAGQHVVLPRVVFPPDSQVTPYNSFVVSTEDPKSSRWQINLKPIGNSDKLEHGRVRVTRLPPLNPTL